MSAFVTTSLAVVLAAGLGTRLGIDRPKALLEIGGRTLLEHTLVACRAAGIEQVIVVTGHRAASIDAWAGAPIAMQTVFNPDYATKGNAASLWRAREAIAGRSFLKLDGDLLVEAPLVAEMAAAPGTMLACDRRPRLDEEAMKVRIEDERVVAIGKQLAHADAESIGLERIDAADVDRVMDALATTDGYYEDAYAALVAKGFQLGAHPVAHRWIEIDDPSDRARAETSW